MHTFTTKQLLSAIRATGLTARSGFDPIKTPSDQCVNVVVLNAKVINIQVHSVLGGGCYGTPEYKSTSKSMMNKVETALRTLGCEYRYHLDGTQFLINGYKAAA
jgi:hypothetical protein